ncbi:MAG: rane metalloprotease [Holophagaceae bacterium]|nr:rane metalloprotease [Holophagaceae bacterium]
MFESLPIATILISYVAVLFALSVHEAAHATAAYLLGDDTAKRLGRMTLNPIAHIDWIGTVLMPLIGAISGFNVLGWAKPVPVDTSRLTRRFRARVGYAMVAAAGPASNLVQSLVFLVALCLYIRLGFPGLPSMGLLGASMGYPVEELLKIPGLPAGQVLVLTLLGHLVWINLGLAIFNLIPFGPLDGAGILRGFLPFRWLAPFDRAQPTITIILLVLFMVGALKYILGPFFMLAELVYINPLARLILGV